MPHIAINNTHYFYELQGSGDPIVLIAGYSCDHTFWKPIFDDLSADHQVLVFDNRAIGQTRDDGSPLSLTEMADDTLKMIKALGLHKPTLVGHSMGGIIAQLAAQKDPACLQRVIIANSALCISGRTLFALKSLINLLKAGATPDAVIEASMPWFFSDRYLSEPRNIELFKRAILESDHPQSLTDLERQFKALVSFSRIRGEVKIPALVIAGSDDIVCTLNECEQIADTYPGTECVELPSGHSSPIEIPSALAHTIRKFCANTGKKRAIS